MRLKQISRMNNSLPMKFATVIFFVFVVFFTSATNRFFHHKYSIDDGLPSNTIFKIQEDKFGNIVLGTDNGLTFFNGSTFRTISTSNGIANPYITSLFIDNTNSIYFVCSPSKLYKLKGSKIIKLPSKLLNGLDEIFVSKYKKVYILKHRTIRGLEYYYSIHANGVEKRIKWDKSQKFPPFLSQGNSEIVIQGNSLSYKNKTIVVPKEIHGVYDVIYRKKDVLLFTNNHMFKINFHGKILQKISLPEHLESLLQNYSLEIDNDENVWFNKQGAGLFLFQGKKWLNVSSYINLKGKENINDIFKDSKSRLWIATHEKGLICIPNPKNIHYFSEENSSFSSIVSDNRQNVFLSSRFSVFQYTPEGLQNFSAKTILHDAKLMNIDHQLFLLSLDEMVFKKTYKNDLTKLFGYDMIRLDSINYLVMNRSEFSICKIHKNKITSKLAPFNLSYDDTKNKKIVKHQNRLFFSRENGIYEVEVIDEKVQVKRKLNYVGLNYISDFAFQLDTMFVASNNTVYKYLNGIKNAEITTINGIPLKFISKIKVVDSTIWIFAANGVFGMSPEGNYVLNKHNFLSDNEATDILRLENQVYITTKNGLVRIELNSVNQNFRKPKIRIKSAFSKTKKNSRNENIELHPDENYLTLEFNIQNYNSPNNQLFEYRINDNDWVSIPGNQLHLSTLSYGNHKLILRIRDVNSSWSYLSLSIHRMLPFYLQIWFFIVCALSIGCILYFIYKKRIRRIEELKKQEIEINNKMVELRQSALSAMMNPHFVFNSLNAIQYYINSNQKNKSSEYLARLARLVRMFLLHSSEPFISLQEEINRLKLYLELENIRFENFSFDFFVSVKNNLNEVKIPNMIVQPFIENAILHGLSHLKTNDGKLIVRFTQVDDLLEIEISDNGFGADIHLRKDNSHVSKGIAIIKERIAMLQEGNPTKIYSINQSIAFDNDQRKGHKVLLVLSIN